MAVVEIENYTASNKVGGPRKKPARALLSKPKVVVTSRNEESILEVAKHLDAVCAAGWLPSRLQTAELQYACDTTSAMEATIGKRKKTDKEQNTVVDLLEQQIDNQTGNEAEENIEEYEEGEDEFYDGNTPYHPR